jgi:hypothetical protein
MSAPTHLVKCFVQRELVCLVWFVFYAATGLQSERTMFRTMVIFERRKYCGLCIFHKKTRA